MGTWRLANYLIREIIERGVVNQAFVEKHCIFTAGVTDIGYGLRNTDKYAYPAERDVLAKQKRIRLSEAEGIAMGLKAGTEIEQKNSGGSAGKHWQIEFEEFKRHVAPYTLEFPRRSLKATLTKRLNPLRRVWCVLLTSCATRSVIF